MTPSLDLKPHTDELVTATGGVRSDLPAPGSPTTIDGGELDDISGGIIDCTPPFPPYRPDGRPRALEPVHVGVVHAEMASDVGQHGRVVALEHTARELDEREEADDARERADRHS